MKNSSQKNIKKLILIGFSCSYKTTAGKIIAEKTQRKFFDVDFLTEFLTGRTIPELFEEYGEEGFRHAENQAMKMIGNPNSVIALGGGSIFAPYFIELKKNSVIVWLKTSAHTVKSRLGGYPRPLFDGLTLDELKKKVAERDEVYSSYADFCVVTDDKTSDRVADEVIEVSRSALEEPI